MVKQLLVSLVRSIGQLLVLTAVLNTTIEHEDDKPVDNCWGLFASQLSQSLSGSQSQQQDDEPPESGDENFEPEEQNVPHNPMDSEHNDSDAEDASPAVFKFTMMDLDLANDSEDEAESNDGISDSELRSWLKDHVGEDWERIYHDTRMSIILYHQ